MIDLVDTHAHLDDEQLQAEVPEILERAKAAGVGRIVTIATTAASSETCIALSARNSGVWASVGIHPNHAAESAAEDWDRVVSLATNPRVVAIGETGLDRHWDTTPFPQQEDYFARHLDLARQRKLPIVIHCREAEADVIRMLRVAFDRHGPLCGVLHSFTADLATAQACLAMGLHISFAGIVTFKNAQALRDVAQRVPLERTLIETDSPYLSPAPLRGKRNEPAHVIHTAGCLASLHQLDLSAFARQTTDNAERLFQFASDRQ